MASLTDLNYTDNMDNAKKPLLTDLRTALDAIETFINDSLKDNLVQLSLDAFGTPYVFDSDGLAQYTDNLYNKTTAEDSDTSGDHTLSTTAAWTDVDATNAAISITPQLAGDFKVVFQFGIENITSNATNELHIKFRLTDGSETSTAIPLVRLVTGVSGTNTTIPVTLIHQFDDWSASAKTVKLQYFLTTLTATVVKCLASTSFPVAMQAEKI